MNTAEKKRTPFRAPQNRNARGGKKPFGSGHGFRGTHSGARSERPAVPRSPGQVPSFLVGHLTEALRIVLKLDGPADVLLSVYFKRNHEIGSRDRGFVAESVYHALRHLGTLAWAMAPALPSKAPRLAALAVIAELRGIDSLSPRDVGNDEKALKSVLQKLKSGAPEQVASELPVWLYEKIRVQYPDHARFFEEIGKGAPLDIRANLLKTDRESLLKELEAIGEPAEAMKYSPDGIRFINKPGITRLPFYREGRADVQDEGSQLIARLVAPKRREMICDFCAGAGGKTLAVGALMRSTGRLYAFDINAKRLQGMVPRLRRSGLTNVNPIAIRDEHDKRIGRLIGKFDRVLVDAPCTGTGTLRRNPDLRWRLTEKELERINSVQASVIRSAARLVKKGGRLVYATCSVLEEENQLVVERFLAEHPEFRLVNATEVLEKQGVQFSEAEKKLAGPWFVMLPQVHGTDGFFGAVLEKTEDVRREKRNSDEDGGKQAAEE